MLNLDIIAWGVIAAIIRSTKDYLANRKLDLAKSLYMMMAGVSCAQLFTADLAVKLHLDTSYEPSIAFILGLLGKEAVEVILTLDLNELFRKAFPAFFNKKVKKP